MVMFTMLTKAWFLQEGCPVRDYGQLLQRYGPNITEEFSEHQVIYL